MLLLLSFECWHLREVLLSQRFFGLRSQLLIRPLSVREDLHLVFDPDVASLGIEDAAAHDPVVVV